jgi:hypothetical protein
MIISWKINTLKCINLSKINLRDSYKWYIMYQKKYNFIKNTFEFTLLKKSEFKKKI